MTDQATPVLHRHHIHTALNEAVKAMKKREEAENGEGWRSIQRQVLEEALEALNERRYVEVRMT